MVLVDTSVWVAHFRHSNHHLKSLLANELVYCHPFIMGELACGYLQDRQGILHLMDELPKAIEATDKDVMVFIEKHRFMGIGLGLIDMYLLASASLSGLLIWSGDKKINHAAKQLRILHYLK